MEKMFDWKKRYYQVHKPNRVDPKALETLTGTKVTDDWKVVPQVGAGIVLNNAAWDLTDYFAVSMNAKVALAEAGESAPNTIWWVWTLLWVSGISGCRSLRTGS